MALGNMTPCCFRAMFASRTLRALYLIDLFDVNLLI